jgi:hypothetical protein
MPPDDTDDGGDFAGGIASHALRSPVATILADEWLIARAFSDQLIAECLGEVMRQTLIVVAALVAVANCVESACAVWVDSSVHCVRSGYRRNVLWPWPYVCPDRIAVREPFCIMINNGWRRQNLLGPHHFNADATKLTTAGELRLRWIMTQAPPERRGIFVERAVEPEITAQRLVTAREYAAQITSDAGGPQLYETHLLSEGRPASVVDATNVRFQESMPPPMLPSPTVNTATGQ